MSATFVLVHGLWSDASIWGDVIHELGEGGSEAVGVQLSLDSFEDDVAAVRRVLVDVGGPVVLVGWSYGGAVITEAATGADNVRSLAYVAAFAPDAGESVRSLASRRPSAALGQHIRVLDGTHTLIDRAHYAEVMAGGAAGAAAARARVAAAVQKTPRLGIDTAPVTHPAWKTLPTHYLVADRDLAVPAETQLELAERMGAVTERIDAPHAVMLTHPAEVARFLLAAG